MAKEKEHVKRTLMGWTKEALVERVMTLERNFNAVSDSFDVQYSNCMKMIDDMNLLNKTYKEAKQLTKIE